MEGGYTERGGGSGGRMEETVRRTEREGEREGPERAREKGGGGRRVDVEVRIIGERVGLRWKIQKEIIMWEIESEQLNPRGSCD